MGAGIPGATNTTDDRTMHRYLILLLLLVIFTGFVEGQGLAQEGNSIPSFEVPAFLFDDPSQHPVDYLASYPVPDATTRLNFEERERLVFLFLTAAQACEERESQDSALRTCSPLYVLLKSNFPDIAFVEREKGEFVFLADIAGPLSDYVGP